MAGRQHRESPGEVLRSAMEAHQAGALEQADGLYAQAIRLAPGNARALRLRGILARERGDLTGSARLLGRAAELAPADPEPLAELGLTLLTGGDLALAEQALRDALARDADFPRALANLGALLQYRGRINAAIELHQRFLTGDPGDVEIRCNLARALVDAGRGDEALAECDGALARAPGHPLLLAVRGAVLCDLGRFADAAASLERACARNPDDDMALVNLAHARHALGDAARAADALRIAVAVNPDNARALADLAAISGIPGIGLCEEFLRRHPGERLVLGAYTGLLRAAGRHPEADVLSDVDRLVEVSDPEVPAGFGNAEEFNQALAAFVTGHDSLLASPASKATRGGSQTGEFEAAGHPALAALFQRIDEAVTGIVARFRREGLADHPVMAYAAPAWTLRSWGTVLAAGGAQAPHMHPLGWLSGVYYVGVPPDMGSAGPEAGWLEFGAPPPRLALLPSGPLRRIEPRQGRLVIFPSWFHHRTLPFTATGLRISIAFDVMPRRA